MAPDASARAVTCSRLRIIWSTGNPVRQLVPRSPWSTDHSHRPYWTWRGLSSPKKARSARIGLLAVGALGADHLLDHRARDEAHHQEDGEADAEQRGQDGAPDETYGDTAPTRGGAWLGPPGDQAGESGGATSALQPDGAEAVVVRGEVLRGSGRSSGSTSIMSGAKVQIWMARSTMSRWTLS